VPVLVENSSNLEAMAEFVSAPNPAQELISVSLGDHIGCGLISGGKLHRGAFGAAGEIGHNAMAAEAVVDCSCTAPNCLESVASARAIAARLRKVGLEVDSVADVVGLASADTIAAVEVMREAGRLIGTALAALVNFFDPEEVVLSGPLSTSVPLVRAIRAVVYEHALPLNTAQLSIRVSTIGADAALIGATERSLEYLLSAERIDSLVSPG
jgi:predicted NBD/HSP70 family sugar kinase